MKIIEYCDENNLDFISSVHFLHALVKRATDEMHIVWALEGLLDHYLMVYIDKGTLGCNKLSDSRHSYVEILAAARPLSAKSLVTSLSLDRT